ncbi:sulfotransferase 1B1-like [Mytilus edulis]|uniref:SULT1 n=1 Tax=Mytilus edulis TaxID=6550 RepID=A0A8S3PUX0_MYTED|nr:SULT1 [Mytilus edulis]
MDAKSLKTEEPRTAYPYITYKGSTFPPKPPILEKGPEKHFADITNYNTRDNDILLCSSQKSGTHWVHEIISMLLTQKTEYNSHGPMWELNLEYLRQPEEVEKLVGPRIFTTHLPFSMLPKKHIENRNKIVYLNRNLKDRSVSLYHFLQGKIGVPVWTWAEYFEQTVLHDTVYTGWFNFTKEMTEAVKNSSGHIFPLMYEDLVLETRKNITNLAKYLEVPYTENFINEVIERCSFKNLKGNKRDVSEVIQPDKKSTLFRKGVIGDWKNWFTVSQNQQLDELYHKEMKDVDVKFKYEYSQ